MFQFCKKLRYNLGDLFLAIIFSRALGDRFYIIAIIIIAIWYWWREVSDEKEA